jgi:arylsulfatase
VIRPFLLLAALLSGASLASARPPDVVLITLDTTRRDHLGLYGHGRPTSPRLDELARRADVYTLAYASSSWTVPTHASILTGRYPIDHGAHMAGQSGEPQRLREGVPTLAEELGARGYATAAFVGAHTLNPRFGLGRGFGLYDAPGGEDVFSSRRAEVLTRKALAWLDEQGSRPVFLFVNYFDPHVPYRPSEACRERLAPGVARHGADPAAWHRRPMDENLALYDAEICTMDEQLGRLLEGLKARGRFKRALIVAVADHGERFDPVEGIVHGRTLGEPLIHVPLVVKAPGQRRGRTVGKPFETRRLFHAVLEAAGAVPRNGEEGEPERPLLVSELWTGSGESPVLRALVEWPLKLVVPPGKASRLHDLTSEAGEGDDRSAALPEERAALEALLEAWLARQERGVSEPVELDPELREKLRALGYGE